MALGHEVKLVHARHVRPYLRGNKNDAADARAIWSAAHQPGLRWVPVKSEQQQAVLSLHRTRAHWVKVRTQTVNGLRGLLYEFGVLLPGGRQAGLKGIGANRAELDAKLPGPLRELIDGQLELLGHIEQRIQAIEFQLQALEKQLVRFRALVAAVEGGALPVALFTSTLERLTALREAYNLATPTPDLPPVDPARFRRDVDDVIDQGW